MMKIFFLATLLTATAFSAMAQSMAVATYNLRYDNPGDSGNLWVNRSPVVSDLIRFHNFDVFGTQEALKNQLDDILHALPQYSRCGVGRDDGKEKGEHSAIFYKKDQFDLLNSGDFWLSETPAKPSKGWDATCCNRLCSWVQLKHTLSGNTFYFFNAHFDHQGEQARIESARLILKQIKQVAGKTPAIFTGDLNGNHHSQWYAMLAMSGYVFDVFALVDHPYLNSSTYNGFDRARPGKEVIDHIFVTDHFAVKSWGVLTDTYNGKFPSDHFPVVAMVELK